METVSRTPRQLAQTLRARRKQLGLTQADAGAGVGLLPKTVSGLEQRPDRSAVDSLFRLLSALGLELVVRDKAAPPDRTPGAPW